ncbi:hypothetical protein C8R45DRAFT_940671 [Mycena sanguinolenta]|nr:hypothetical protein C8R45DRAFT_940671 [Mycena sanguinolenta]
MRTHWPKQLVHFPLAFHRHLCNSNASSFYGLFIACRSVIDQDENTCSSRTGASCATIEEAIDFRTSFLRVLLVARHGRLGISSPSTQDTLPPDEDLRHASEIFCLQLQLLSSSSTPLASSSSALAAAAAPLARRYRLCITRRSAGRGHRMTDGEVAPRAACCIPTWAISIVEPSVTPRSIGIRWYGILLRRVDFISPSRTGGPRMMGWAVWSSI